MFDHLKEKFPHLQSRWDSYLRLYKRIEVPARTILLKEGEVSKRSFLIEQGCLRVCFNNGGKDVTFQFFFENDGVSSMESFRKNTPSMFTIETIEPCVLHVLQKKDYDAMMRSLENDPVFLREMMDLLFERQLHYMREFLSFVRDTPKQRYLNLIRERPHILQRVPQHYIASYLGITSVSLSRIRGKIHRSIR